MFEYIHPAYGLLQQTWYFTVRGSAFFIFSSNGQHCDNNVGGGGGSYWQCFPGDVILSDDDL